MPLNEPPKKSAEQLLREPVFSCLILEDDPAFAEMLRQVVSEEGGQPTHCASLAEARRAVAERAFDLLLLDNHLPDGKSYDLFHHLSRRLPDAPIIMITGLPDLGEAISLTRNGLFDYLTKPIETDTLLDCLRRARLRMRQGGSGEAAEALLSRSAVMREVAQQLQQAARHPAATVLLTGESGSGKDVAARALHRLTFGERAAQIPYVALNCAAVPGEMFEAELFGAERGAYTGADKRRPGFVASAQGGTLFLDEIAEVPLPLQAKLLRLLEGREFRALGGAEVQTFTGRFVAATNKHLPEEVRAGRFREDLWYRIEVFTLELPPLRRRREDIPLLVETILDQLAGKYQRRVPLVRPEDLATLVEYSFPGNVRELRNLLERGLLRTADDLRWLALDRAWLKGGSSLAPAAATSDSPAFPEGDNEALPPERSELSPLEAQEYRLLRAALRETKGGIRRTAAKVGLSPQALLRRLEKWPELRPRDS